LYVYSVVKHLKLSQVYTHVNLKVDKDTKIIELESLIKKLRERNSELEETIKIANSRIEILTKQNNKLVDKPIVINNNIICKLT